MSDTDRAPRLLQQFARLPVPGRVKTRLARSIGAESACAVHEELLSLTGRRLLAAALGPAELWLNEPGSHSACSALLSLGMRGPFLQRGEDLGERMYRALDDGRKRARRVVLVGSDCPGLDPDYLRNAFAALDHADAVLGPADDGGYVLVGVRRDCRALFSEIPWGTDEVLERSLAAAEAAGIAVALLAPRYDIDDEEDLRRWRGAGPSGAQGP